MRVGELAVECRACQQMANMRGAYCEDFFTMGSDPIVFIQDDKGRYESNN